MKKALLASLLLGLAMTPAAPAMADGPIAPRSAQANAQAFTADRAAILAMAGDYKVTFDLRETTSWRGDYTPIPSKLSGGHEVVRVIEDTGRHIALQHLLVVKDESGKTMVIKHWRQDWNYEPENLLTYAGKGEWKLETIPATMRAGRWSQTVWQTDDSPAMADGANGATRAGYAAGVQAGRCARWPGAMRCAIRPMTAIWPSIAIRRRRRAGSIGRTI
jgi:hypothetical protein